MSLQDFTTREADPDRSARCHRDFEQTAWPHHGWMRMESCVGRLFPYGAKTAGMVVMAVTERHGAELGQVHAQMPSVLDQQGALARIEQQTVTTRLDMESQPMLGHQSRAMDGVFHQNGYDDVVTHVFR